MKLGKLMLVILASIVLMGLLCPAAQADGGKVDIEVKAEVGSAPSVSTGVAWPVSARWAILHGELTDMGTASSVDVYFEWGETTDYGSTTRVRALTSPRAFWAIIWRLTPATTYHFRAVAVGDGISYGEDMSFTTRGHWWWR